jgi:hypothetical protein
MMHSPDASSTICQRIGTGDTNQFCMISQAQSQTDTTRWDVMNSHNIYTLGTRARSKCLLRPDIKSDSPLLTFRVYRDLAGISAL